MLVRCALPRALPALIANTLQTGIMEAFGHLLLDLAAWLEAPTTGDLARVVAYGVGIVVLIVVIILIGKFAAILRLGTGAGRFATRNGWTYDGMGQYSGKVGSGTWRGGPHEDDDSPANWTEFRANLRIDRPGECVIVAKGAWQGVQARRSRSDEPALQIVEGCSPAFARHWVLAASDPGWREVLAREVEALLLDWPGVAPDKFSISCGAHAVEVRISDTVLSAQADLERFFKLGEALARACVTTVG